MRSGLIAQKIGMTQVFTKEGAQVPVTVLKVDPCTVVAHRTKERDGYVAIQIGSGAVKSNHVKKSLKGYFSKLNIELFKNLKEFRVSQENVLNIGQKLDVTHFEADQYIDVSGVSLGKGFAGSMKRHHFGGLRASHGVSVSHRSHGSTGNRTDPGKVFKNKKMAGQMGARRVTKLNLNVHSVDIDNGLLFVKGSVPGPKKSILYIRDAIKKKISK